MKRREFISLVAGAAAAWPLAARAQQTAIPVIGYLSQGAPEASAYLLSAFRKGLSEGGYDEGKATAVDWAPSEDYLARGPGFVNARS